MALGDLIDRLLEPIWDRLKAALKPFSNLINLVSRFFTGFKKAFDNGKELSTEIVSEINEWKNFKENINVKNRVISIPKAIDQTEALIEEVKSAWQSIVDLSKQLRDQFEASEGGNPTEEAEQAMSDIEASGFRSVLEKFPKLAKGFEKVLGFVAIVVGALESIASAINDIKQIVDTIRDLRKEIETGDTVFLKSSNPRKTVTLDDGTTMKIRVGSLHPS